MRDTKSNSLGFGDTEGKVMTYYVRVTSSHETGDEHSDKSFLTKEQAINFVGNLAKGRYLWNGRKANRISAPRDFWNGELGKVLVVEEEEHVAYYSAFERDPKTLVAAVHLSLDEVSKEI